MKYILMPSLEHIALVKIVSTLWNQEHIRTLIMAYLSQCGRLKFLGNEWQKIEETIMERVPQLLLPRLIENNVLNSVKPIGMKIVDWIWNHYKAEDLHMNLPVEFCWTPQGIVDQKRTAQMFVRNENIDILKRYEWACFYCLVDDIPKLWMKMPDRFKQSFLKKDLFAYNHRLVYFWTINMQLGEKNDPPFSYQSLFEHSAIFGNKAATEYLLTKLTPVEIEHSMVEISGCVYDPDILCFLLSEMDEEKQIEFLKSCYRVVLEHFLDWPLQSFFIGTVTCVWDFLKEKDYCMLLNSILKKHLDGFKDWNYQKLWGEIWEKGSVSLKSYVINASGYGTLKQLLHIKDKENCRLMLKDVTTIEKKKLTHCHSVQNICMDFLRDFQWDPLEFFIQKCLSSKDEMLQFKEELEKRIASCYITYTMKNKHKWDKLFCLSDNCESKDDKRTLEEGQSSSSKRLRSLQ